MAMIILWQSISVKMSTGKLHLFCCKWFLLSYNNYTHSFKNNYVDNVMETVLYMGKEFTVRSSL